MYANFGNVPKSLTGQCVILRFKENYIYLNYVR